MQPHSSAKSPETVHPGLLTLTLSTSLKVAKSGSIVSAAQMQRGKGVQGKGCRQTRPQHIRMRKGQANICSPRLGQARGARCTRHPYTVPMTGATRNISIVCNTLSLLRLPTQTALAQKTIPKDPEGILVLGILMIFIQTYQNATNKMRPPRRRETIRDDLRRFGGMTVDKRKTHTRSMDSKRFHRKRT